MTDSGDRESASCSSGLSGTGLGFPAGRGLPSRVRSLSSPTPHGRLTSLRTRDLTLGGTFKKTKKIFEPNVHAVRKSKDELKEEMHVAPKKERREREERRRENRGRRREKPQTIQSHSIFEQGPADTVRKTGWRGATDLCDSTASPVCKLVKKERKESEEDEDEMLRELQRDNFIDDPGLKNDAKLKPIQLPLSQSSSFMKSQTLTCTENPPLFRPPSWGAQGRAGHSSTQLPKEGQPSLVELLQDLSLSGREELFFMQLPDCMPARASAQKANPALRSTAEKPAKKDNKSEDKRPVHLQAQEAVVKEGCPVLSEFSDGLLGKLQIRKSGKVELKLGDIVMDVSEGAAFSFLQQLVSVHLSDSRTGDMMVLGNVQHKLVLSPDFQALLQQAATQQQQGP
ncbi:DNA-directed RNA polymerase III subunit RPC4 isoform X1 [Thunnus maccoyii]|uniref:DNA-directed RNA polymerase III subunit RPC4 isoform X1 n=1 Tax=Thunnus maccoyii TaxID=8240 RepID=UPI001C4C08C0|nr:DNA-directed RNA polymerase III subunit RPC4 isoform X1 [Thunnus maccoyii]XP_042252921.1 DNA-directed RNA polymerase III subunit RPC4 isoform X1 [Thunnus maccoyii]